ncbi:MAG: hypothetical protein CVV32_09975 [Methanomicrobiales archaeon HGW-Methanomicrobiales-3]|jgi:flagellar protein FlaF|nr:MAG: hypothetical protein CVV32_09975 [Methanomicrobiales archaeon HGW-Methanomicrobiales-3]
MAVAEIIGAAIGVLLLVVVAYILVGSTLTTAEVVVAAQNDLTLQHEQRLRTSLTITSEIPPDDFAFNFSVKNTGSEIISNFAHMDILTSDGAELGYTAYTYQKEGMPGPGYWSVTRIENDYLHPNSLDPGESMWCMVTFSGNPPIWFQVTTANGVSASAYLI